MNPIQTLSPIRGVATACLFACLCAGAAGQATTSPTYEPRNLILDDDGARAMRSGSVLFSDEFSSSNAWSELANYRDLLTLQFGDVDDSGKNRLLITRADVALEETDTAWRLTSHEIDIAPELAGREYVLRTLTSASQRVEESGADGDSWRGAIFWRDRQGRLLERREALFSSQPGLAEATTLGAIPPNAASATIQIGCDAPNVTPGHFVALYSVALEVVEPNRPYPRGASFISEIAPVAPSLAVDANIPQGCALRFQIATAPAAENAPEEPSEVPNLFLGPDGSPDSFYEITASGVEQSLKLPENARFMRYRVSLQTNGGETPTLREIRLGERVERNWREGGDAEPPRVKIVGGRATPQPAPNLPLEFELSDASFVRRASVKIYVDDGELTDAFDVEARASGGAYCRERNGAERAPGLHCAVVEAQDAYGNSVRATRYFLVGDAPKTPRVTLRDDGATLIDGEPFFPIGIYGVTEREFNGNNIDEAFRGLKEAGFNFAHSYSMPRTDRFLAAAEKYGFKLWSLPSEPDERFVEVERHSPAIIAWYLGDDTSYNTRPEELFDRNESIKAVDPTRLTVQADPVDSGSKTTRYRAYVDGTDAFLPEIYPVREDGDEAGRACVAQTIRDMRRSREDSLTSETGVKAIWPIIQYFQGWGWKRFPTNRELRAMSFASLAAGANGITWYTYGGFVDPEKDMYNYGVTTTPERWRNISALATQIQQLSPVLLERTDPNAQPTIVVERGPATNALDEPAVIALYKRHGAENYLIAVNSAFESVDVLFLFPKKLDAEQDAPELLYLDEDDETLARPKFQDGALRDSIERLGTRVYRWTD